MSELNGELIKEVASLAYAGTKAHPFVVPAEDFGTARVLVSRPSEVTIDDITDKLLASLPHPQYRKGTVKLTALDSFGEFTNRMKEENTVLFADADKRTLLAVFDYHDAVNQLIEGGVSEPVKGFTALPQWGRYRAFFSFPQSRQYKTWKEANKKGMSQAELASFIEDNVVDVMAPSSLQDDKTKALVHQLGLKLAGPDTLLSVARGLSIKADEQFTQVVNLNTGETQVVYAQSHAQTASGEGVDIKVPTGFIIAVPVFEGDAYYQLLVRLKYRKGNGSITWHFDIYNIDRAFDDAFEQSCSRVQEVTELPLFYGQPE